MANVTLPSYEYVKYTDIRRIYGSVKRSHA